MAEIEGAGGTGAACYLDVTDESSYETLFSMFSKTVTGLNFISTALLELYFHRFARTFFPPFCSNFSPPFCAEFAEARFGGVDHVFLNAGATTKLVGPGAMETDEGACNPA